MTASCMTSPSSARQTCLDFLRSQVSVLSETVNLPSVCSSAECVLSNDWFGIVPFYMPRGVFGSFYMPHIYISTHTHTHAHPRTPTHTCTLTCAHTHTHTSCWKLLSFKKLKHPKTVVAYIIHCNTTVLCCRTFTPPWRPCQHLFTQCTNNISKCSAAFKGTSVAPPYSVGGLTWSGEDKSCNSYC